MDNDLFNINKTTSLNLEIQTCQQKQFCVFMLSVVEERRDVLEKLLNFCGSLEKAFNLVLPT